MTAEKLNIAFYDASDGPRIMLFGSLHCDIAPLSELFRSLSGGMGPYQLETQAFVQPVDNVRIRLICGNTVIGQKRVGCWQGVRRTQPGASDFEWQRGPEGWDYLAELIEPFLEKSSPGHQYLSAYPKEDAIIVLSKGEYSVKAGK